MADGLSMLIQVTAPHFVAGLILDRKNRVKEAAPILRRTVGRNFNVLKDYFDRKGWNYEEVTQCKSG